MTLPPRTLLGRNLLLIVSLVVLGQISGGLLVRELLIKPRLEQVAEGMAHTIQNLRAGLVALPSVQRATFVQQFNAQSLALTTMASGSPSPARFTELSPLDRAMVQSVSRRIARLGDGIVWRREAGGSLALRITLDGADYWVGLPGLLPVREATGAWLAASLIGALLALGGALLIQRRIHRPLNQLAQAARQVARGMPPSPLPTNGPHEIAAVAYSFNQMARELQQADQQRALMLAGVSHDLRTPLTKLRLGVEILRAPAGPELAASMERSIGEMDAIIGQFLDFARDDGGEPLTPTDLAALARDVAEASAAQGHPVALQTTPGMVPQQARARLLRRALVNLVENAWRHGQPPVTLRVGDDARHAWLEVEDHGPGIDAQVTEQLKQPFARGEAARGGPAPKGAGLGLAIVERAAQAHGGRLELLGGTAGGLRARIVLAHAPQD
ncbi:MAG TPA: ATP-binding protein [Burkholderiaceae bacterium]